MNVLDGELTLKSSRGSSLRLWFSNFCPGKSSVWLIPARRPIWEIFGYSSRSMASPPRLTARLESIGARHASSVCWS